MSEYSKEFFTKIADWPLIEQCFEIAREIKKHQDAAKAAVKNDEKIVHYCKIEMSVNFIEWTQHNGDFIIEHAEEIKAQMQKEGVWKDYGIGPLSHPADINNR
jgi:hypothetical protein